MSKTLEVEVSQTTSKKIRVKLTEPSEHSSAPNGTHPERKRDARTDGLNRNPPALTKLLQGTKD